MMKRIGIFLLALMVVLALGTSVCAAALEENGETGVAGDWIEKDTERAMGTSVNIKKEILSFNANNSTVHAPVVTYTYTVTPATKSDGSSVAPGEDLDLTVLDETGDHAAGSAVTVPVKAGITEGLVVNQGAAGTASSAAGTLEFNNATTWNSSADGNGNGVNSYNITLNFHDVNFSKPGVYRYKIAETLSAEYDEVAMEDGGSKDRYLDVYVDGNSSIYGYVCMDANTSITPTNTSSKTNGFVSASDGADKYYTYDLTLDKDVVNDAFGETHPFPFTVTFSNPEAYTSTFTVVETASSGSTGFGPTAASAPTWTGTAYVKEGSTVTYTGIPAGVDVSVYETNDMVGVTYHALSKLNDAEKAEDASLAPSSTSTPVIIDSTKIAQNDKQALQIVNSLLLISPTGVVLRIAPYVMILVAGIVLLLISRRRKAAED